MATVEEIKELIVKHPFASRILEEANEAMERERAAREEFYQKVEPHNKWEFINGEIVVQSPARPKHMRASDALHCLLRGWVMRHGAGEVFHEKALISLTRNDFEPDLSFFKAERAKKILEEDHWKLPPPDLVVEVLSPSTEKYDRGVKFEDYARHGVEEYWIADPWEEAIEQYLLAEGSYRLEVKLKNGDLRSRVLQGLVLPVRAVFDKNEERVFLDRLVKV